MQSKKEKIIYWLLGLGSGIAVSGMVMLGVSLGWLEPIDQVVTAQKENKQVHTVIAPTQRIEAIRTTVSNLNLEASD